MEILGWIIWFFTCGYGLFSLVALLYEVIWRVPSGYPQALYPVFLRRLITGFAGIGFIGAAAGTVLTDISKLHLLWFVPAWHFFGIQRWIEWIYLLDKPELIDLIYPESNIPWWFSLCCPLSPSLVPDILRKRHRSQRRTLSANGWERFPTEFVKGVRQTLGAEQFDSLTLLAEKYGLFEQPFFAHPEDFEDIDDELTKVEMAVFLTDVGKELYRREIVEDAEKAYRVVLACRPEHFATRGHLAAICYDSGRLSEAREHARRAITDMDSHAERYKDVPVPEHIADPNAMHSFRSMLQLIAEGKTFYNTGAVTTPASNPLHREITSKVIDRLDLVLWELSKVILSIYVERFPDDSNEHNFTRVGTLVNELVKKELRGEQLTFRANNPDFVAREKTKLLRMEKVRKGVISFLVAKAALYKSWGHSDADIWIERAKELEPDAEIPGTLDEISRVIESCLSYYESC